MLKIQGVEISEKIIQELKKTPVPKKFLAIFVVGSDYVFKKFVLQKEKIAKELGVDLRIYELDGNLTNDKLKRKMQQIMKAKRCGGAVLQLPLPSNLNSFYLANSINPNIDIEVMSERSLGGFYHGRSKINPPSVDVVIEILENAGKKISDFKKVAVIGEGFLVGRPITNWLFEKAPNVYCFTEGCDFSDLKLADLVISGVGKSDIIKANMLKKGAGIIDFGYGMDENGKLKGDFDELSLNDVEKNYLDFYTPTPRGTGPVLVACLFRNFYKLNK